MSKMTKRKALISIAEDEESRVLSSSNQNTIQATQSFSSQISAQNSEFATPTAFSEKRKKISTNFSDLSQLVDFQSSNDSPNLTQLNKTKSVCQLPRTGIIERVYLKNFKCHSLLEFNLHPYINFILGRNGSGKSAVMDAIILCLGGKAASTGRQASAKTFIKTNCERAELSVTIRNEGEEAYKYDLYGSKITVERKISKDGQSQYRLLNEFNKLISNKKQEVDNIIEQFNLQVENPVCFLNQETSKHFLNSSNKSDKYKLFMKASQLESMRILQEQIEHERQSSANLIIEKETYLPKLKEELYQWEDKYKKCQSVDKLRKKLSLLMHECSWAYVIHWESVVEKSQKEKRVLEKSKEKLEQKIDESEKVLEQSEQEYNKAKQNIGELTQTAKNLASKQNEIAENFKKAKHNYQSTLAEIKKFQNLLDKKTRDKKILTEKLNEDKKNSEVDYEEEKRQKESKLEEIKSKLSELSSLEKFKNQENQRFFSEIERTTKLLKDKEFELSQTERLIRNNEDDIKKLMNAQNDQIYKFGDFMPALVKDVQANFQQGRFKELPRGPIGMYIQPKNSKWNLAIEQCLGQLVTAFVCGSYEDERLMHQLMAKHINIVKKRPRVIVNDFKAPLYDVSEYRPENTQYPTVYEMLNIKDSIIANTLIDQRRIESVILLPDRSVGRDVIENNSTPKCYEAFLPNGDHLLGRPSFKMYACRTKEPSYFFNDSEGIIQQKRAEIQKYSQSVSAIKQELVNLSEQVNANRNLKKNNDKQLDTMRRDQMKWQNKLREVESINIPEPVDIKVFEDEIYKLEQESEDIRKQIEEVENNSLEQKTEYDKAFKEKESFDLEAKKMGEKIEELKTNFTQLEKERTTNKTAVNHYKNLLKELEPKEKEIDGKLATEQAELEKVLFAAQELSPRIETKRNPKQIDNEIQSLEKQIELTQKLHGNEEEITKKYMEMRNRYKKITEDIKKQNKFLANLKRALESREEATSLFTQSKALRCSMDFTNYLSSRDFKGQLKFDHEEQKLDIIVNPSKSKEGKESKDLKSLSGGERSFSTVAFLLALWSIVECPILFLDEFDVFMDQVNRSIAMELILSAAKEKLNGQYVFLTPQEMGAIKPDEYVKMFKMPDPRRAIDLCNNIGQNQENEEQ